MRKLYNKGIMHAKITRKPKSLVLAEVTLTGDDLAKSFEEIFSRHNQKVEIKGFRPGKAPRMMSIEKIGANFLSAETMDKAINDSFVNIIKKEKINPVARPKISVKKWVFDSNNTNRENDILEYNLEISEFPKMKLGEYKNIKIDPSLRAEIKATHDEVEKIIDQLKKQQATYTEVDRKIQNTDLVELDYEGNVKGVVKEQMTSKNHPLTIGSKSFVPGFEEKLIGHKKDDEFEIDLTFPKDYYAQEFQAEKVKFKIKINLVKEVKLPELDNVFAGKFGHSSIANLKKAIRESLNKEKEDMKKQKIESAVLENALKYFKVELNDIIIEEEQRRSLESLKNRVEKQGIKFDQYLTMMKKDEKIVFDELKNQAIKNIEVGLLLGEIARAEKIAGKPEEIARKTLDFLVAEATRK